MHATLGPTDRWERRGMDGLDEGDIGPIFTFKALELAVLAAGFAFIA